MAATYECPKCGRALKVPAELAGKKVKCPACQTVFMTSAEETPPPPPPEVGVSIEPEPASTRPTSRPADYYEEPDEGYRPRSRRDRAHSAIAAPAIALMVLGIVVVVLSMAALVIHIYVAIRVPDPDPQQMAQPGFAFGFQVGKYSWSVFDFFGICLGGLLIFGATKMKSLSNYGLALAATIIAMLPCHYCCLLGIPFGIWALITLMQEDVKSAFR